MPPSLLETSAATRAVPRESLLRRFLRWLVPDRRRSPRHIMPPLVAYLGVVGASKPYKVGDISCTGFFMLTQEHWLPGTYMPISLERTDLFGSHRSNFITVQAYVVRNSPDGVGFGFLIANSTAESTDGLAGARWVTRRMMADFLVGLQQSDAAAHEMPDVLSPAS